ncbi:PREDICTED: uncharacterized protein LOC109207931 [Nicotiana attenuata]|uniref:uncharacterized protein LOC109207931 n=1 Tax=Nicotiana attenuata TaxID=49451 RepID=UPI000904E468|nr:PREDICTED: uncharacterized protein LOC109207931 [Nicotiana attenuata]
MNDFERGSDGSKGKEKEYQLKRGPQNSFQTRPIPALQCWLLDQAQQQTVAQNDDITELEEAGTLVEEAGTLVEEAELLVEEAELLEEEVKQKAERIAEYRGIILAQLETDISSIFAAQRPVLGTRFDNGSVFNLGPLVIPAAPECSKSLWYHDYPTVFWITEESPRANYLHGIMNGCSISLLDVGGPTNIAMLAGEERKEAEKIQLLKKKNLESASAIPVALNRMKDCMARIDKLQSCNGVIHPTFKRKRSS